MTIEAMKQALEALEAETDPSWICNSYHPKIAQAITSLRQAIEQAEKQEPCKTCNGSGLVETGIGMMVCDECKGITSITLPKREWVGLTKDEKEALSYKAEGNTWTAVELAESKLKEQNNG